MTETVSTPFVVVGIDGSPSSKEALRWAANYAALSGAEVHAVITWRELPTFGYPLGYTDAEFIEHSRKVAEEVVHDVLGDSPPAPVTIKVLQGHPATVLIGESRAAALLVVGSRGLGAFAGPILGSVSQRCVNQAECSVTVVRHPSDQP